jgi:hypothetical protein
MKTTQLNLLNEATRKLDITEKQIKSISDLADKTIDQCKANNIDPKQVLLALHLKQTLDFLQRFRLIPIDTCQIVETTA